MHVHIGPGWDGMTSCTVLFAIGCLETDMLQRNNAEPAADNVYAEASSPEQAGLGELVDFAFGFLRRQYVVILFFTLVAARAV